MKIIVDECLPNRLTKVLSHHGHEAVLVQKAGYGGLKDGALLSAIQEKFAAFVTIDGNLTFQQNLSKSRIGIIVLEAPTNTFEDIDPLVPKILKALEGLKPGSIVHVQGET
ncbi:hypothetical protein BH24DEI2_BH24DEI2_24650 [soil metagenome]